MNHQNDGLFFMCNSHGFLKTLNKITVFFMISQCCMLEKKCMIFKTHSDLSDLLYVFHHKKVVHFNFLANNWSLFEKDVVFLNKLCVVEPCTGMNISKSLLSYIAFRTVKNNPHQLN